MIFSPQRNFCFIHVPKTGGTSIEWAYGQSILFGDIILDGSHSAMSLRYGDRLGLGRHASAAQVCHYFGVAPFQMMLSFAVIREPVDRLVSYYRWIHSFDHDGPVERALKKVTEFEMFASVAFEHLAPQHDFVTDSGSGELLVSFLVPFTDIDTAWRNIAERLRIIGELPHKNSSNKKIAVEVTDTLLVKIRKLYAKDVALYKRASQEVTSLFIDTAATLRK